MTTPFDPATLAPTALWRTFETLSRIPRGSGDEAAVLAWLKAEAQRLGLPAEQDGVGNLLVRKPATPGREDRPVTTLQGHVDMVCEQNRGTGHDFGRDSLRLRREGDFVRAEGTTLGADNGIGVAAALAVLAATDLPHGPLECLFTVDEERGLTGAMGCREGWLRAAYLLNLDGEDPSELTISCAGGLETQLRVTVERVPADLEGSAWRLRVGGLRGGHSGVDIHLGRGNAIRLLARALDAFLAVPGVEVAHLEGGSRRNVIPREASALLLLSTSAVATVQAAMALLQETVRAELGAFDPDVTLRLEAVAERPGTVLAAAEVRRVVDLLSVLPHGPLAMSPDLPGLVQTSTNLAVLVGSPDTVEITLSHRGSVASAKEEAGRTAAAIGRAFGCATSHGGAYPGWKPEPDSDLVALAQSVYAERNGSAATLRAIHAGLECGILGAKHPGMRMISFGPHILDAHSPDERVSIPSVERFWDFLTALLARI